ncbi:hypothetical protein [Methylobacterium nigriterrae]|uniref:hypothetical protein n=1 Tax=Methylobacterium nigriterrae TaxID=3127512 RepID=UPI003013359F
MTTWTGHPFVIDVRPCRVLKGRFVWTISRRGYPKQRSIQTFATFEEARLAGKTNLAILISNWRRSDAAAEEPKALTAA